MVILRLLRSRIQLLRKAIKYWWQRRKWGFSDKDLWNLDGTIARFVLPRFQRFKQIGGSTFIPSYLVHKDDEGWQQWLEILDEIEYALGVLSNDELNYSFDDTLVDWERVDKGLELFGKNLRHLWY